MLREQRRQLEQLAEKLTKLEYQQNKTSLHLQTQTEEEKVFPAIPTAAEVVSKPVSPPLPEGNQWPKPIGNRGQIASLPPKENR